MRHGKGRLLPKDDGVAGHRTAVHWQRHITTLACGMQSAGLLLRCNVFS